MKKFILISAVILFSSFKTFGQQGFYEPAYFIQQTDTVKGYIERTDDLAISHSIKFKTDLNKSDFKVYLPSEIKSFGFYNDHVTFKTIQGELRNADGVKLVNRFGKILLSGYLELYKLPLSETETNKILLQDNNFIYVVLKEDKYFTLGQYEHKLQHNVHLEKRYIGVLTVLFKDCPEALNSIANLQFADKAIIEKVKNYNRCVKPDQVVKEFNFKSQPIIKHGPEMSGSKIFTPGQPDEHTIGFFDSAYKITSSKGFSAGYFLEYLKPDISPKTAIHTGINYLYLEHAFNYSTHFYNNGNLDTIITTVEVKTHSVRIPFTAQYNFYKSYNSKVYPFVNFGATARFFTNNNFKAIKFTPLIDFGFGLYTGRFRHSILLQSTGVGLKTAKIIDLSIGYNFQK